MLIRERGDEGRKGHNKKDDRSSILNPAAIVVTQWNSTGEALGKHLPHSHPPKGRKR